MNTGLGEAKEVTEQKKGSHGPAERGSRPENIDENDVFIFKI